MPEVILRKVNVPCQGHTFPGIEMDGVRMPGLGPDRYTQSGLLLACRHNSNSMIVSDIDNEVCFEDSGRELDPGQEVPFSDSGALSAYIHNLARSDVEESDEDVESRLNVLRRLDPKYDGVKLRWEAA